jgi:hypothetical protein
MLSAPSCLFAVQASSPHVLHVIYSTNHVWGVLFHPFCQLQITREAGPVKGGSTVIAFAKDPTGYMWELIQRPQTQEPLCQVGGPLQCCRLK